MTHNYDQTKNLNKCLRPEVDVDENLELVCCWVIAKNYVEKKKYSWIPSDSVGVKKIIF